LSCSTSPLFTFFSVIWSMKNFNFNRICSIYSFFCCWRFWYYIWMSNPKPWKLVPLFSSKNSVFVALIPMLLIQFELRFVYDVN
jgi:hypothetical protein